MAERIEQWLGGPLVLIGSERREQPTVRIRRRKANTRHEDLAKVLPAGRRQAYKSGNGALCQPAVESERNQLAKKPSDRLHVDRIARGDSDHCHSGSDPLPRFRTRPGVGAASGVSLEPEAARYCVPNVRAGL